MNLNNKIIIITGAAGFIGSNLVMRCLQDCEAVNIIGIDNMNDYYDVSIKEYRLQKIEEIAKKIKILNGNLSKGISRIKL